MGIRLFGHRGAAGQAPENTLGGFDHAWGMGVRAFELDIHLSKDGELVVIHDPLLERTTNGSGRVSEHTAAELNALNAACQFPGWPVLEGVPSLQAVLESYHERIQCWQLEIKTDGAGRLETIAGLLARQIDRCEIAERVTVTSFDPQALEIAGGILPHVRRGLIRGSNEPGDIALARSLGCAELCVNVDDGSPELVAAAHAAGLRVTGWLGNTAAELERLLAWGVEAITSDYPGAAIRHLADKGLHPDPRA